MFRISEFASFTRVSVKMLRHYDEIGLLRPVDVDADTGYRHYSASQLPRLNRIIALKDLGFTLGEIATLLDAELPIDQIRGMLRAQRARTAEALHAETQRLTAIESRLALIERDESLPDHEIVLRSVPALRCASVREEVSSDDVSSLFEELERYVGSFAARAIAPPLLIEHGAAPDRSTREVEVVLPISKEVPGTDSVAVRTLPAISHAACVIYTGSYAGDLPARSALLRWAEDNRWVVVGPMREVFLRFGADQNGYTLPDAYLSEYAGGYVTELQLPLVEEER